MLYGLYLSGQGAQAQTNRLDVLANNLANASTGAFKRDLALFQAHQPRDVEQGLPGDVPGNLNEATGGLTLAEIVTDFSDGPIKQTGGQYHLALSGPGFFTVNAGNETLLTRDGRFTVDSQNQLVTADAGHPVLGAGNAPILIPPESRDVNIGADGTLIAISPEGTSEEIGRINLVQPASLDGMEKIGSSLYRSYSALSPAGDEVRVLQGHLEESSVRPVLEMMSLIEASRAFEANVNMMRMQDESLGQLLKSVQRR